MPAESSTEPFVEVGIVSKRISLQLGALQYRVPGSLEGTVRLGALVRVPLRGKPVTGYVVETAPETRLANLLPISSVVHGAPRLTVAQIQVSRWISDAYLAPLGECLKLFLPPGLGDRAEPVETIVELVADGQGASKRLGLRQKRLLEVLTDGPISLTQAHRTVGIGAESLRRLQADGLIRIRTRTPDDITGADAQQESSRPPGSLILSDEQSAALAAIESSLAAEGGGQHLLYGETGSGKTEVYLRAARRALTMGRSVVVLVPEISLTPQLIEYFSNGLRAPVAVWHSGLGGAERLQLWHSMKQGRFRVVIGARSALFSPLPDIGLVVIDEEHETSYKQDSQPRYVTREVARRLCDTLGAVLVLGSATPSVESLQHVRAKTLNIVRLKERVVATPAPEIKIVDMRREFKRGNRGIFSEALVAGVDEAVSLKAQAILFVNRRGYGSFWLCRDCGHVSGCPNCDVSLSYHDENNRLVCHHCGYQEQAVPVCPRCRSNVIRPFGTGTQKVVSELRRLRPELNVLRLDGDVMTRKNAFKEVLREFIDNPGSVLVGTQVIAKGLDIPAVRFVGVVNADTALWLPDFRAGERTFQLLRQVAGRAGRGRERGNVVIQTYCPDHYALKAVADRDDRGFYNEELKQRREHLFPPFADMVNLIVSSPIESQARDGAVALVKTLASSEDGLSVYGPMPASIARIAGRYRQQVVIKGTNREVMVGKLRELLSTAAGLPASVRVTVDVDPVSLL